MKKTFLCFALAWCLMPWSTSQNIMITDQAHPNEPSIMMDPLHPEHIIAASNLNNYFISRDTGRTWSIHTLQSSHGVWGDPVIAVDINSHFYFFHLSNPQSGNWIDRIVCQKTTDNGMTWSDGSYTGLNGAKAQDKQWCAIDRTDNTLYLTWTQFDVYGSNNHSDSSSILFSKSTDSGATWTPAKRINKINGDCRDSDNTVEGAVPAIGPNGEVYVSWAGPMGIVFDKSIDKGATWLDTEIPVDPMPTGWDYTIPEISRANGLPVTVCDLSSSPYRGTIYINWSDQRNGSNDTDIWLAKSTDGGESWTGPIRVNDDGPGKHQFFTWMTVDQTTGYLYFIFYDRRNYANEATDVYLAVSKDGGNTFINRKISETPFLPDNGVFFGDYTNITVHNGIVRPIWTRLDGGTLSLWTHLTTAHEVITSAKDIVDSENQFSLNMYPNPTSEAIYVSYKLHERSIVNLSLLNTDGKRIHKILSNEQKGYGKYVEEIDLKKSNIPPGVYFLKLEIGGKIKSMKQVILQ